MLDRELMLYKLGNYGFDKLSIQLLSDYFKNRIKIDEIQSQVTELLMGIIQGSCLGPLLFIIFINDLPSFLKNLKAKLFADDTTIIFSGNSLEELNSKLKNGILSLNEWCKHNRLYINWNKTFIMFINNKRVELPTFIEKQLFFRALIIVFR